MRTEPLTSDAATAGKTASSQPLQRQNNIPIYVP
jgi:hypothetical protein